MPNTLTKINNIKLKKIITPFKIEDIIYLEADKNFTKIKAGTDVFRCSINIKKFEHFFISTPIFIRVHRSYMINLAQVKSYNFDIPYIKMQNNDTIPVGIHYLHQLMEIIRSELVTSLMNTTSLYY